MSLESELATWFRDHTFEWKMGGIHAVPDEDDLLAALDEAAKTLYNEPVGTRLEVGRLIIVKKHKGHDVYVFAGTYE